MENIEQDKTTIFLKEKFGDAILAVDTPYDFLTIVVRPSSIVEIIQSLYGHSELQYQYLTSLCAVHYPDLNQFAIVYQLHSLINNKRIRLKIYIPVDNPVTPTITNIFSAANWLERETYDFYGVQFQGHPDLRRILNVDEMIIFPLRKEYPLEDQTREDKQDYMFGR
jgi:NADH-quinone oxidoreductase subunit C